MYPFLPDPGRRRQTVRLFLFKRRQIVGPLRSAGPVAWTIMAKTPKIGVAALAAVAGLVLLVTGCGSPSVRPTPSPSQVSPTPGVQGPGTVAPDEETSGTSVVSGVTGGVMFGGNTSMAVESANLGRKLAIVRTYYTLNQSFPKAEDRHWMSEGSTEMVSLDTKPGSASYADIAAGDEDAAFSAFLKNLEKAAVQYNLPAIYFCFEHAVNTPGHHQGLGTPAQFVRAWDHLHQLAASEHLNWNDGGRIHWVLILTHEAFVPLSMRPKYALNQGSASDYYPGKGEVDVIGVDGYQSYGCPNKLASDNGSNGREEHLLQSLFDPAVAFAWANGGLPVFITEWGSTAYPSTGSQVSFIHQMQSFVDVNHEVAAAMYWDNSGGTARCNYTVNGDQAAVSAIVSLGHSSLLQGHAAN
jgi:hypothetical protein